MQCFSTAYPLPIKSLPDQYDLFCFGKTGVVIYMVNIVSYFILFCCLVK
ncbi:hypothetical protein GGU45_002813 [Niabella hirudinis]